MQKEITVESNGFSDIARENLAKLIAAKLKAKREAEIERQIGERKIR